MTDATPQKLSFRQLLESPQFAYGVELVTTRGIAEPGEPHKLVQLGEALCADPRIGWISVTDNPGGNPMLPADWLGRILASKQCEVVIHLTCKDLNRNGLESAAWRYAAEGFNNILALTGDLPTTGYGGKAGSVFDLDSVSLIALLSAMNDGLQVPGRGGKTDKLTATSFYLGGAVSPFKRLEAELMPQYFKLARKIHCGAQWIITQLGYDMRKFHDLLLFMKWAGVNAPVIGNVYVLNKTVAKMFHDRRFPGCVVSAALLEKVQQEAGGPDKGRSFFEQLAAKQLAVLKGLGFAAGYLAGASKAETFFKVIELAESYGENDWKDFAREIQFPQDDEFYLFERDPQTGLCDSERMNEQYLQSLSRPPKTANVTLGYRLSRAVHNRFFTPDQSQFPRMQKLYQRLERNKDGLALRALNKIEHVSKALTFGCKECGDCSLPETAYLCPRSACSKTGRNGPCGGSFNGRCELDDKECLWVRAYERLKYYGESQHMLEGPAVFYNAERQDTSSWANFYLGRDHHQVQPPTTDAPPPQT
ncbi:MAG: methylenetetrahydrofolate reductase C-terminal domain-containing protein [Phycisphaeraceae bacterium]|nr:methylenetetrahydrofolate reductase C-terminal domain-containing protein [Phycisphaeraceae bacterium]